ncbi:aldehyde dehydrogenase family protein, partial [candidate division KSB1 bacterium]|nr:aldehyde dehydrogenase family protein [candidate division KSB1 bacterium]
MEATAKPEIKVHNKLYINGQWVKPASAGAIDVINSTTEEVMGRVPEGAPEDVNAAVAAARAAFEKWSTTSTEERARYLQLISDRMNMRKDEIAALVASEVGMPLPLATAVQAGMPAAVMGSYAKMLGEFKFEEQIGNAAVVKEPMGVVGCIT